MLRNRILCMMGWFLFLMVWFFLTSAQAHAQGTQDLQWQTTDDGPRYVLPSNYYSEPETGTYYLYNVAQGQFLVRLSNNFPGLSNAPAEVKLAQRSGGYTITFADGKCLKTGSWNKQYLWTDGSASDAEAVWTFEAISGRDKVYRLKRTTTDTFDGETGIFCANGTNAATTATDDCQWALISPATYVVIARENAIPARYRSAIPTAEGQYYLYDMLNQTFLNTEYRTLSEEPKATATLTPSGSAFLISGASGKYLKIGVYKGQYLWSDGDANSTKWTIEPADGEEAEKLYYIYTKDFTETNAEVKGKTMYLDGTNATSTKPAYARWALITEKDYVDYISSGEGTVDTDAAAANKTTMTEAKGDATDLLQNPTFERSADGWWGGERGLCQLYRGSGYAFEASEDGSVMLQTIKNMPRGTYKVVAAVRGANGTSVTARVADNNGETVVNHGTNAVSDQLNLNGVKMPYSTLGGFSTNENAQGWNWATATGTLDEDGHLKVEFVTTGNGRVSVADVHLYYMGDGTEVYAVEYTDGVDATAHAVTCDLVATNPNRLFTSNGTITTISGAKLNNDLVGGTVANLVLYDGYSLTPTPTGEGSTDFIANKATFYGNIEAGIATAVCLPFAITGGANGTFYEVKSQEGSTLKLQEVKKPEAGKAYIYRGEAVTTFTGSGNVKGTPVASALSSLISTFGTSPVTGVKLDFEAEEDDVWQKPQVALTDFAVGHEYYLYNVGAARFYTEGNSYGTQASIGETGLKVKFEQNGDAVKITNYSNAKKAWRTMFITTNGAMYVDAETATECYWQVVPGSDKTFKLMMSAPNPSFNQDNYPGATMGLDLFEYDLQTRLAALLFTDEEPGEGLYLTDWAVVSTSDYDAYQTAVATYKTALQLKELIDEAKAADIDVSVEETVYANTASTQEELTAAIVSLTNKMIEDELKDASREHPLDLTDKFIINPRYENNDNEGWQGSAPGIDAANNLQNAEFFNTNFDCYQDLVGLPDGTYRVSVQGFYRAGLEGPAYESKIGGNEESVMNAQFYVTTGGKTTTTKMQSVFNDARSEALGVSGEIHLGSWWVPNNMSSAAAYFAAGYYNGNSIEVKVTSGKLRIGMRKTTTIRRDWTMLDNWKLEYLGK